ncbi:MAG: thioredoxin fold domain-containing protein [Hyphomicrobium sp.]|jgi:thioredoxin-related protein
MRRLTLDTATNVGLLVASAMMTIVLGQRLWSQYLSSPTVPPTYQQGDTFPEVERVNYGASDKTVVLFVASTCKYCTQSMPFYEELARGRTLLRTQLLAVGFEPESTITSYLAGHRVQTDAVLSTLSRKFKFAATPTLVVLDSKGVVLNQWVGALNERQNEVRQLLGMPTGEHITGVVSQ